MTKKIKIMHFVQAAGGVACYLSMLFKYLDRSKFSNVLICSRDFDYNHFSGLVDCFEYIDISREISPIHDLRAILILRKIIRGHKPDIIYCHSSKAGAIGRIAALGSNAFVIYNPHGWAFNMKVSKIKRLTFQIIERFLSRITDKIIVISNFEKVCALKKHICVESKINVIFNGVDIDNLEKNSISSIVTKDSLNIPNEAYVIGMVGRITAQKAPDSFVLMASLIKKMISNAFFIIVGDGDERSNIEYLIKKEGLENCFLITGWVANPNEYIAIFDQAVLLSRWEGFGLALVEYMVCKKPIVSTNVDAIPDLIDNNYNGILVNIDDYHEAAKAIIYLRNNENVKSAIVQRSYDIAKIKFNVTRVAKEHENIFLMK